MALIFDAFWRSLIYCFHPRVVGLSLLPLLIMGGLAFALGMWYWTDWVTQVGEWLDGFSWLTAVLSWLESISMGFLEPGSLRQVLAPLTVLTLATPAMVMVSLLLVGFVMTPAMVSLVAKRRFPDLERRRGASLLGSVWWALVSTVMAVLAMLASLPFWLIPPLMLVLPPLIWGWLTYRVFAFDALADHASSAERKAVLEQHRGPLLAVGVLSGYLGALPGVFWASGAFFVVMAPVLIPLAIWLYTLVFAFSSLWFAHYALSALARLRQAEVFTPVHDSAAPIPSMDGNGAATVGALDAPPDVPRLPNAPL